MDHFYVENNFQAAVHHNSPEITYPLPGSRYQILNKRHPLKKRYNRFIKRSFDILLSIIIIITTLSWLIPLFAIIIRLDSRGPVFFRQKRNRNNGKLFSCIKFRTMIVNDEADRQVARINDERVTRFGKFLRHYHFDELPQAFNVLMGDMSVIGPRPYMVNENRYYENLLEMYAHRHTIKPGITGLAQSFGYFGSLHDLEKVKERVDLDIHYIYEWSLGMDIRILCRTFLMITGFRPGAGNPAGILKKEC